MIKVFYLSNFGFQLVLISAFIHLCVCVFYSEDLYNQKNKAVFISCENEKILSLLGYISFHTILSNFYLQDS